jgi:TPR repeat protein
MGAYLTRLGFNDKVVRFVTSADADEMNWLTKNMADKLGIAVTLNTEAQRRKSYALFADGLKLLETDVTLPAAAAKLYRQSAEIGYAGAQNNLADFYEHGEGVPKNHKAAIYWYTRAAERGEPTAYLSLAHMLSEGTDDADLLVESAKFAGLAFTFLPEGKNKASAEKLTKDNQTVSTRDARY